MNLLFSYENICAHKMQTLHIECRISVEISSFAHPELILSTHNSIFHSIHTCLLPVCICALSFRWLTKSLYCQAVIRFHYNAEHRYQSYSMETNAKKWQEYDFDDEKEDTYSHIWKKDGNLYDYWAANECNNNEKEQNANSSPAIHPMHDARYEKIMRAHMLNIQMFPLRCT